MNSALVDVDTILSGNEQWAKLGEVWGKPIDLDTEEDETYIVSPGFSTLDLRKSTFDSSFLFKKVRKTQRRQPTSTSALKYEDFLHELIINETKESSKQYYFINGEIVTAASVEDISDKIDDIFKSIDKLACASSTIRRKGKYLPEIVSCSISVDGLSFDDTLAVSVETDMDDIDKCIEEALERFNSTLASLDEVDEPTISSVTALVQKFSNVLNSPLNCNARKPCCAKFKDLADFWSHRAFSESFKGHF